MLEGQGGQPGQCLLVGCGVLAVGRPVGVSGAVLGEEASGGSWFFEEGNEGLMRGSMQVLQGANEGVCWASSHWHCWHCLSLHACAPHDCTVTQAGGEGEGGESLLGGCGCWQWVGWWLQHVVRVQAAQRVAVEACTAHSAATSCSAAHTGDADNSTLLQLN